MIKKRSPLLRRMRNRLLRALGQKPTAKTVTTRFVTRYTEQEQAIVDRCRPHTMTSPERLLAILDSVRYLHARGISGAFVECGVWRGGSVMAMILQLMELGVTDRDIYLYDTFEGMTAPTAEDVSDFDGAAQTIFDRSADAGEKPWEHLFNQEVFNLQVVRETLLATGYPAQRLHFVQGPVEDTIPGTLPEHIALLRLDTDWYESTRHELQHLWPKVESAGVLIIDDFGHWDGCRKAVEEYFDGDARPPLLLSRIDYSGRMAVKA